MADAEINWDRLDKRRFFFMGVGLFSGVTTALYPLSVIKTRQMANNSVSGGLSGTKQTAVNIWQREGVKGFYRGFGTVVFGTIPSRSIYLSALEMTKAAVQKVGQQADMSPTTLAATSSFLAGAAASLSTQIVIVPVDVISQRLMVQGDESGVSQRQAAAASSSSGSSPSTSSTSSSVRSSSNAAATSPSAAAAVAAAPATSATPASPAAPPANAAKVEPPSISRQYHSSSQRYSAISSSNSSSSSSIGASRVQQYLRSQLKQRQGPHHSWGSIPADASTSSSSSTDRCVRHKLPCSTSSSSTSSSSTSSSSSSSRGSIRGVSSSAAARAAPLGPRNGFQMARAIVAHEGIRGLYRGFWPSVATFAPSSAVWWGSYGYWQKLIWINLDPGHENSSSSSSTGSNGQVTSTGQVVAVQTTSAVLAGCTASLATNPLDVVKTRLQVAESGGPGGGPSWRLVLLQLLSDKGVGGCGGGSYHA